MPKRYQVFISSTFADLEKERNEIMRALMRMNCIPAGMELFPAADEDQMHFIKRIIDDCDYYILLIGGRYGSMSAEGISYTEMEYDYAKEKGLRIIALLHKDPDAIPLGKTDKDPLAAEKLSAFRIKVSKGRLINYWTTLQELPGQVALSLMETITTFPAVGWVRGDSVASEDLLRQINDLRLENETLRSTSISTPPVHAVPNLAGLDEEIEIGGKHDSAYQEGENWHKTMKWSEIFWHISPSFDQKLTDRELEEQFTGSIKNTFFQNSFHFYLHDQSFHTIIIQLRALGLVQRDPMHKTGSRNWELTPAGEALMFEVRTSKSSSSKKH